MSAALARLLRAHASLAAAGATALLLMLAAVLAMLGSPPSRVVVAVAVAFVPYAWLLRLDAPTAVRPLPLALALAAACGVVLVAAPPLLSDDLFRYLWDGRVLGSGINPYAHAPDAFALTELRDPLWARINHRSVPTIYPPLAQVVFLLSDQLAHAPWAPKLLALLAHLGTIPLVARLAGDGRAALLYGLNPLALTESALSGHVDVFVGLAVVACVLALVQRRPWLAALLSGAASGLKLVGLLLLPAIGSVRARAVWLGLALLALAVLPLLAQPTGGLGQYARRWRGNEGAFLLLEQGLRPVVASLGDDSSLPRSHRRFAWAAGVFEALDGTALDLRSNPLGDKKAAGDPTVFSVHYLAALGARALALGLLLGFAAWLLARRVDPLTMARSLLLAALLLAPQVHPWYLLWLLPLEVAAGRATALVWSAAILVAYAPLDGWLAWRQWDESALARAFEYAMVGGFLFAETLARKKWSPPHVGKSGGPLCTSEPPCPKTRR